MKSFIIEYAVPMFREAWLGSGCGYHSCGEFHATSSLENYATPETPNRSNTCFNKTRPGSGPRAGFVLRLPSLTICPLTRRVVLPGYLPRGVPVGFKSTDGSEFPFAGNPGNSQLRC